MVDETTAGIRVCIVNTTRKQVFLLSGWPLKVYLLFPHQLFAHCGSGHVCTPETDMDGVHQDLGFIHVCAPETNVCEWCTYTRIEASRISRNQN